MLDPAARLLRLLSLLQARSFWTGGDLAERLEVTPRTLRRDIDRLRSLGYPVDSSTGVAGGYQLSAGSSLPPLQLDDDEAQAMTLGLRSLALASVSGLEEAAMRAVAKIDQVLPERLRPTVDALQAAVVPPFAEQSPVDPSTLLAVAKACRARVHLGFAYTDGRARQSDRIVEAHGVVHTERRWYLAAWDLDREDWRTFRIDRIIAVDRDSTLLRRFKPREIPGGSVATYVADSIRDGSRDIDAEIVLHAAHDEIRARIPVCIGQLEAIDATSCRLVIRSRSPEAVALHLCWLDVEFEVRRPPEVLEALGTIVKRCQRAIRISRCTQVERA